MDKNNQNKNQINKKASGKLVNWMILIRSSTFGKKNDLERECWLMPIIIENSYRTVSMYTPIRITSRIISTVHVCATCFAAAGRFLARGKQNKAFKFAMDVQ